MVEGGWLPKESSGACSMWIPIAREVYQPFSPTYSKTANDFHTLRKSRYVSRIMVVECKGACSR